MSAEILIVDDNADIRNIINDHNGELEFFPIVNGAKIEIDFKLNVS